MAKKRGRKRAERAKSNAEIVAAVVAHYQPAQRPDYTITMTPEGFHMPPLQDKPASVSWTHHRLGVACYGEREAAVADGWLPPAGDAVASDGDQQGAGPWSPELVRAGLTEAVQTLRLLQVEPGTYPSSNGVAQLLIVRDATEAYGYGEVSVRRRPTAVEIAHLDQTLPAWLLLLDDPVMRKAVIGVAMRLDLRAIGRKLGCSHEWARRLASNGMKAIAARLNAAGVQNVPTIS